MLFVVGCSCDVALFAVGCLLLFVVARRCSLMLLVVRCCPSLSVVVCSSLSGVGWLLLFVIA